MNTTRRTTLATATLAAATLATVALANSNISDTNKLSWQENTGFNNWRDAANTNQGAVVLGDHLAGFVWNENTGFISLGTDASGPYPPTASQTGDNFGVNINTSTGLLSGYAWSENTGWINFDTLAALGPTHAARFDDTASRLRGFAWGENTGWFNLDDANIFVEVEPLPCPADTDNDGFIGPDDLFNVLANFGQLVAGGPSDGDVAPPGAPDGIVTPDDLFFVLSLFGQDCNTP